MLIEAGAGVGKTSLLDAACALARRKGRMVLRARGSDLERGFAFGIARAALRTSLRRRDRGRTARAPRGSGAAGRHAVPTRRPGQRGAGHRLRRSARTLLADDEPRRHGSPAAGRRRRAVGGRGVGALARLPGAAPRRAGRCARRGIASGRAHLPIAAAGRRARGGDDHDSPVAAEPAGGRGRRPRHARKRHARRRRHAGPSRHRRESVLPAGIPARPGTRRSVERAARDRGRRRPWRRRRCGATAARTPAAPQPRRAAPGAGARDPRRRLRPSARRRGRGHRHGSGHVPGDGSGTARGPR